MTPRTSSILLGLSLMSALLAAQPAFAAPGRVAPAATLGVTFNFQPSTVSVNSQTQIYVSISGGTGSYWLWFNASIPGCNPSNPIQQTSSTASYPCKPSGTGNFNAHLDVADNAGNHGSGTATLNVQSSGGNTGGNNTGNNTGGFNLGGLTDLLGVFMIVGIVFLACTVAIAASAVALAVLVPRRLKQIRKAIEGEPMRRSKESAQAPPPQPAPPAAPKEEMPKDDL